MANSWKLSDGTTDIELVYNTGNQTAHKVKYGARMTLPMPVMNFHEPDDAEPQITRAFDTDRTFYFELHINENEAWDDVLNRLATLRRWVDGANQQAIRYHERGDVDRIYLRVQLDGATNYTDHIVHYGFVDDGGSLYESVAHLNKQARNVVIGLTLKPYGEGATITLHNDLGNPAFLFEGSTSGLAAQWSLLGSPTQALDTTNWLIGGQSQKIVATSGASDQGVQSASITCGAGTDINAFVWLYVASGDQVTVILKDGSNVNIDSVTLAAGSSANSDKSATDTSGNTWYRVSLSGSGANANCYLQVKRASGDASAGSTFYIDGAYIDATSDTLTVPDAWMSGSAIENRGDQDTSNPEEINYVDVWGIPGDAPAVARWKLATDANGGFGLIAGRVSDGQYLAADFDHWIEANEDDTRSGSWSNGTGTSANNYRRFTEAGTPAGGYIRYSQTGTVARNTWARPLHVFALCRTSDTAIEISFEFYLDSLLVRQNGAVTLQNTATWEWVDLGAADFSDVFPLEAPDNTAAWSTFFSLALSDDGAAAATFDIDAVVLVPAEELLIWKIPSGSTFFQSEDVWVDGVQQLVLVEKHGFAKPHIGSLWFVPAGNISTRTVWGVLGDYDNNYGLNDTLDITLDIIPRTRHLLGTV